MAHRYRQSAKAFVAAAALLLGSGLFVSENSAWADDIAFSGGSLIIPMQANFQNACGVTSAYGLIWQILRANQPGHYFANANHMVTVYLITNGNKISPNRCVPSNLTTAPSPWNMTGASGDPTNWDDPEWNDGCDFAVNSATQQPVVPVDYTVNPAWPDSGQFPYGDIPFTDTSNLKISGTGWDNNWDFASPGMPATTLNSTVSPAFSTVQYMGAPFVIDAADAPYVIQFLRDGDAFTTPDYLQRFTATTDPVSGLASCPNNGTTPSADYHHVNIHQATERFTAPVLRRLNRVPPKVALLDEGAGVKWWGFEQGGIRVLDTYLKNANLFFPGAAGCPPDTFSGCTLNGGNPGQIYDQFFAYADLISTAAHPYGVLNSVDSFGRPLYTIFWAPHWETNNPFPWAADGSGWDFTQDLTPNYPQYQPNGDGAADQKQNALNNIAYFGNQRYHGLMAECASLGGYEGTAAYPLTTSQTQFLFTNSIDINELPMGNGYDGRNCSDPSYLSGPGGDCVLFDQAATNPFAQLGDYHLVALTGAIQNFGPDLIAAPPSKYRAGVSRMAVSWSNYGGVPPDFVNDPASGKNGWDFFDFAFKDGDNRKAAIVYIAGHEYSNSTAGNRIVLNTLLNLGFNPTGNERALSHPVAYNDPNGASDAEKALVFASTYVAINSLPPGSNPFDYTYASKWRAPVIRGHLRAHSLLGANQLAAGENDFGAATLWDAADMMPLPAVRNLFTYFGGYVKTNPSTFDLGGANRAAPNNVLQLGWIPANVAGTAFPNNCVDVMQLGETPDGTCGMIPGSDGICDLQEALQYTQLNLGTDCGQSEIPDNQALLSDPDTLNATQQMVQIFRGFCAATDTRVDGLGTNPILEPSDGQCNDMEGIQLNRAQLGGLVHSSPAIIPASPNVSDGGPKRRPTVAYVAGLDGQVHAFYVSGGAGYDPPLGLLSYVNPPANAAFPKDWLGVPGGFSPPLPGTELWSFIPSSQLPWLRSGTAQVDSSPVVQDVFIDIVGSGIREWHTVLLASVGGLNREIIAIDVSNPLRPVLLWDVVGSLRQTGSYPYYSPTALVSDAVPSGSGTSPKWRERDALFKLPCNPAEGCDNTGVYDYLGLGGSLGLSIGEFRRGLEPVHAVFVASNSSGANGITQGLEVFAIEIATGQKLWQWEYPYQATKLVDNSVPAPVSVLRNPNGAVRVFVPDMEGNVWELDAATGMNANIYTGSSVCTGGCKFTAFTTNSSASTQKPVTTNLALARLPNIAPTSPTVFAPFANSNILVFGTGGEAWVPFDDPGELHVLFLDDRFRKPYKVPGGATDLVNGASLSQDEWVSSAATNGVLLEKAPPFPLQFPSSHLYGAITVSGQTVFFETTKDRVPDDINWLQGSIQGGTFSIDLGNVTSDVTGPSMLPSFGTLASYGGVTVYHDTSTATPTDYVLTAEVSKLTRTSMGTSTAATRTPTLDPNSGGTGVFYTFKGLIQRFLP